MGFKKKAVEMAHDVGRPHDERGIADHVEAVLGDAKDTLSEARATIGHAGGSSRRRIRRRGRQLADDADDAAQRGLGSLRRHRRALLAFLTASVSVAAALLRSRRTAQH